MVSAWQPLCAAGPREQGSRGWLLDVPLLGTEDEPASEDMGLAELPSCTCRPEPCPPTSGQPGAPSASRAPALAWLAAASDAGAGRDGPADV